LVSERTMQGFRLEDEDNSRKRINEGFQQLKFKHKVQKTQTQMREILENAGRIASFQFDYRSKNAKPEKEMLNFGENTMDNHKMNENWSVFRKGREIEETLESMETEEKEKFQISFLKMKKSGKEKEFRQALENYLKEKNNKIKTKPWEQIEVIKQTNEEEIEQNERNEDSEVDGYWIYPKKEKSEDLEEDDDRKNIDSLEVERKIHIEKMRRLKERKMKAENEKNIVKDEKNTIEDEKMDEIKKPNEKRVEFQKGNKINGNEVNEGRSLDKVYKNEYQDFLKGEQRNDIKDARTLGFALSSFRNDLSSRYFYRNNCYKLQEKLMKINGGYETIGRLNDPIQDNEKSRGNFIEKRKLQPVYERKVENNFIKIEENTEDPIRKKWMEDREKSFEALNKFLRT